jgi:antigen 43
MATFTWTATGSGGNPTAWESSAWFDSADPAASPGFNATGTDYVVGSSNPFTINDIGGGALPDVADSLTVTDLQASLLMTDDGSAVFDITDSLSLNGLLNMGTAVGGSVLSLGGVSGGGTITLGSSGRLEGALGDVIQDVGTSPTEIMGAGTIIAEGGLFQIGTSYSAASTAGDVDIAIGDTTLFTINPGDTLQFFNAVGGGTIALAAAIGTVLEVSDLADFNAKVKGLFVGQIKNVATNYIDFLGTTVTATLTNITSGGATLTVAGQVMPVIGDYIGKFVNYISDGNGGTNVFITDAPCYAAGTAILTPHGEVAVETIEPGDVVTTSEAGRLVPQTVIWAGVREIDLTDHPKPEAVAPIRIRRGALADGLPRRDLLVSPDHCLFVDGGLIPAKLLINGMTIVRDLGLNSVSYHHIELERHAVLLAEGVPAESYLDTGNRAYFSNAGLATILRPELGINAHLRCWGTDACAPLTVRPEAVKPVWERFVARATALGFVAPEYATTTDPGIRLLVDGRTLRPLATRAGAAGQTISFVVPEGAGSVRLVSRSTNPALLRPWLDDPRHLGVAVCAMVLRDRTGETVVGADHPALTDGWYAPEHALDGTPWRWSDGDAVLPLLAEGPCQMDIVLSETMTYVE